MNSLIKPKPSCKAFALISAIATTTLLIIVSTTMIFQVLANRVSLRREQERAQVSQSKEQIGRQFMEALTMVAQGTNSFSTNSLVTSLLPVLLSGSRASSNAASVHIYDFDTNNPLGTSPAKDIIATPDSVVPMKDMNYPTLRFGYVQTNAPFIARPFAYRAEYSVAANDNLVDPRSVSSTNGSASLINATGSLIISILEIPAQLGVEGENIALNDPSSTILGSVSGRAINVSGSVGSSIANIATTSLLSENGTTTAQRIAKMGADTRDISGAGNRFDAAASGSVMFVPVGKRGLALYTTNNTTPDTFTAYWHPYYQCTLRAKVSISPQALTSTQPATPVQSFSTTVVTASRGSIQETPSPGIGGPVSLFYGDPNNPGTGSDSSWMWVVRRWNSATGLFVNEVEVELPTLMTKYPQYDSIFINSAGMPVVLRNGAALTRPFSIVATDPIYIPMSFGTTTVPFSLFAPAVYYGNPGARVTAVSLYGQRGITSTAGTASAVQYGTPTDALDGYNSVIAAKTMHLAPVQESASLPPVYLKSWLINIWELKQ